MHKNIELTEADGNRAVMTHLVPSTHSVLYSMNLECVYAGLRGRIDTVGERDWYFMYCCCLPPQNSSIRLHYSLSAVSDV